MGAIILAAGKGTRMRSDRAKVLHEIGGIPMIRYVVESALAILERVVVVVGHQAEAVRQSLRGYPSLGFSVQEEQRGTGHAVMTALPALKAGIRDVLILCGDTPLIRPETLQALMRAHKEGGGHLTLLAANLEDPHGYGRIVCDRQGRVRRIVEEADASEAEKEIRTVNTGTYCMNLAFLGRSLPGLRTDNAQKELYLTDVVAKAFAEGVPATLITAADSFEVLGVNTVDELARAEGYLSARS